MISAGSHYSSGAGLGRPAMLLSGGRSRIQMLAPHLSPAVTSSPACNTRSSMLPLVSCARPTKASWPDAGQNSETGGRVCGYANMKR